MPPGLEIIDELGGGDHEASKHSKVDTTMDNKDMEMAMADESDIEMNYVKLSTIVRFIMKQLKMSRHLDELRLTELLEVILCKA